MDTKSPRLFPAPLEYTLIVLPFILLNENTEPVNAPVPENSTPVTVFVRVLLIDALFTLTTDVRSLDVCDEVPPNTIPLRTTSAVEPVQVRFKVKSSTRHCSPIVKRVVELVTFI